MKKFIIPVICVIVLGCLAGVIVYMNYRSNLFTLPGQEAMETEIKKLGYDVAEPERGLLDIAEIKPVVEIYAKPKSSDGKNAESDINFTFTEYKDSAQARNAMSTYYYYGEFLEEKKGKGEKVKIYYNEKKNLCYVVYDIKIESEGKLENFIVNASSGNSLFEDPTVDYIYGGVYMDGKRIVSITTSNPKKAYDIGRTLGNLGLPKP